jgi:hypothetical protein
MYTAGQLSRVTGVCLLIVSHIRSELVMVRSLIDVAGFQANVTMILMQTNLVLSTWYIWGPLVWVLSLDFVGPLLWLNVSERYLTAFGFVRMR